MGSEKANYSELYDGVLEDLAERWSGKYKDHMEILHRFVINKGLPIAKEFIRYISKDVKVDDGSGFLSVVVSENDKCFCELSNNMRANSAIETVEALFDQEEIDEAEWLYVRSKWQCSYPQPRERLRYLSITYDAPLAMVKSSSPFVCRCHLHQVSPFVLNKTPAWKSKCFTMLNWVYDELFVCDYAKKLLEQSDLHGFGFYELLDQKGNMLGDISQIMIHETLEKGLNKSCIDKTITCFSCGERKQLLKPGRIIYDRQAFNGVETDIIKTSEIFGEITGARYIFISHRFYDYIHEKGLDKNIVYVPVQLI